MKKLYKYKKTKLLHGVGINDADYPVIHHDKNRKIVWRCPFYKVWSGMISRCYTDRQRCYIDCSVVPEWHSFMTFRSWMITQDWKGKCLDKDIIMPLNRIYAPNTCIFITQDINKLLNEQSEKRGKYPLGVYFNKPIKRFVASVRIYGKSTHLGCFDSADDAETAYKTAKSKHIHEIALNQCDERIRIALLLRASYLMGI